MAEPTVDRADLEDMQALIGSGFGTLRASEYVLLDVVDPGLASKWLDAVRIHVRSVRSLKLRKHPHDKPLPSQKIHDEAWSIAFTWRGLRKLGVVENPEAPFPSDFRGGQSSPLRRTLLRDDPQPPWQWGDAPDDTRPHEPAVSILVARFHDHDGDGIDATIGRHPQLTPEGLAAGGLRVVRRLRGCPASFRTEAGPDGPVTRLYEPFGFRDGLAQPALEGLRGGDDAESASDTPDPSGMAGDAKIALGEVVLGHRNAFGEPAHCPEVQGPSQANPFGRNGCYLAVRQIFQDVDRFEAFEAAHPSADGGPSMAERLLGRHKSGAPLQSVPAAPTSDDAFRFRMNDSQGMQCPLGAHIRRANPRDGLTGSVADGVSGAKLHRLLRRGRPYQGASGEAEGLVFIALVADLARQFEFVKRVWIGNPTFAGMRGESDPVLGRDTDRAFMVPAMPLGSAVPNLANFTRVEGGGYFFMPGLAALELLATGCLTVAASTSAVASVP